MVTLANAAGFVFSAVTKNKFAYALLKKTNIILTEAGMVSANYGEDLTRKDGVGQKKDSLSPGLT